MPFSAPALRWLWRNHPRRAKFALVRGLLGVAAFGFIAGPFGVVFAGIGAALLLSVLPSIRDAGRGALEPPYLLLSTKSVIGGGIREAYELTAEELGPVVLAACDALTAEYSSPTIALVSATGALVPASLEDALGQGDQAAMVAWGDPGPPTAWPDDRSHGIWLRLDPLVDGWTAQFVADSGTLATSLKRVFEGLTDPSSPEASR